MTRQYFLDYITDWYELLYFSRDHDIDFIERIYSYDERNEWIDDNLENIISDYSWQEVRDYLDDIETGFDYYIIDEGGVYWEGLDDDDFEYYKEEVCCYFDENNLWDDEDDDEEDSEENDQEQIDEITIDEPITLNELFCACLDELVSFKELNKNKFIS